MDKRTLREKVDKSRKKHLDYLQAIYDLGQYCWVQLPPFLKVAFVKVLVQYICGITDRLRAS